MPHVKDEETMVALLRSLTSILCFITVANIKTGRVTALPCYKLMINDISASVSERSE